jgi:hypothetical protein
MPDSNAMVSGQAAQRELAEPGRALPGVTGFLEVYGNLLAQMPAVANVWPGQVRDATRGNAGHTVSVRPSPMVNV